MKIDRRRPEPEVSCIGKEQLSMQIAQQVAGRNRERRYNAYRCTYCGHWHVGTLIAKRHRRRD